MTKRILALTFLSPVLSAGAFAADVPNDKDLKNNKIFVSDYAHRLNYLLIDPNKLFVQNKKIGPVLFSSFIDQPPVDISDSIK
jgi:hypothetical protein